MDIVIITARGNNTFKDKNLRVVAGKPLLYYPIMYSKLAGIEEIFVTTDDEKIQNYVEEKFPKVKVIIRPEGVKGDVPHEIVIRHAIREIDKILGGKVKNICILLGNSAIFDENLIKKGFSKLKNHPEIDSIMSVFKAGDTHPFRALIIDEEGYLKSYTKLDSNVKTDRQSYPAVYYYDQAIWIVRKEAALEHNQNAIGPWSWMGTKSLPIINPKMDGNDVHNQLDLDLTEFWIQKYWKKSDSNL